MVYLEIILGLNLLKQYVDSLRRIHHFLSTEETLFILILDVQGIVALFDVLLESLIYLHHSTFASFLFVDGELITIKNH